MLALGAAGMIATAAVAVRDPHVAGSWGRCPVSLLGLECPGCGGLRAVHDLVHLDVAGAASHNLLVVVLVPLLALGWLVVATARLRGVPPPRVRTTPRAATAGAVLLGVAVAAFTLARNLPGSWLAA